MKYDTHECECFPCFRQRYIERNNQLWTDSRHSSISSVLHFVFISGISQNENLMMIGPTRISIMEYRSVLRYRGRKMSDFSVCEMRSVWQAGVKFVWTTIWPLYVTLIHLAPDSFVQAKKKQNRSINAAGIVHSQTNKSKSVYIYSFGSRGRESK